MLTWENNKFSRKNLILNVADTDGGTHVDPELDEKYMAFSRKNSLGVRGPFVQNYVVRLKLMNDFSQMSHEEILNSF